MFGQPFGGAPTGAPTSELGERRRMATGSPEMVPVANPVKDLKKQIKMGKERDQSRVTG